MISRLEAIGITAKYAQDKIASGKANYGDFGVPNFQSILHLVYESDDVIFCETVQTDLERMKRELEV